MAKNTLEFVTILRLESARRPFLIKGASSRVKSSEKIPISVNSNSIIGAGSSPNARVFKRCEIGFFTTSFARSFKNLSNPSDVIIDLHLSIAAQSSQDDLINIDYRV